MRKRTGFRPRIESIEDRCVPTAAALAPAATVARAVANQAVVMITNTTGATVSYQFRWGSSLTWTRYTLTPGQSRYTWITLGTVPVSPQVQFDASSAPGMQAKTATLGYNTFKGDGTPPASAGKPYAFRAISGGIDLAASTSNPGTPGGPVANARAVIQVVNSSTAPVGYKFRWTASSPWTTGVLAPGKSRLYSAPASGSLSPQIEFDGGSAPGMQAKWYALAYNTFKGSGTPPASAAKVYTFRNVTGGIELFAPYSSAR